MGSPMLLMIDNYDSFTFNLVQYLQELGETVEVRRNDAVDVATVETLRPDRIVISPGPCTPDAAGISLELIAAFADKIPILGVCLGHQAIAQVFGGRVVSAKQIMHGKTSEIHHNGSGLFAGLPSPFVATRYHSLAVTDLPDTLKVTAWTVDEAGQPDEIMGLAHVDLAVSGVQFHPESILTEHGHALLANFLGRPAEAAAAAATAVTAAAA